MSSRSLIVTLLATIVISSSFALIWPPLISTRGRMVTARGILPQTPVLFSYRKTRGDQFKLGEWTGRTSLFDQIETLIFQVAIENTIAYLEKKDRVALEYFESMLFNTLGIVAEGEKEFQVKVLEQLRTTETVPFEFVGDREKSSSRGVGSSSSSSSIGAEPGTKHVIHTHSLASFLMARRDSVVQEMLYMIPNIVKENNEAVFYATVFLQNGEGVARRSRMPIFDTRNPNTTATAIYSFAQLDFLVTNVAIDKVRSRYIAEGQKPYQVYLDKFVEMIDASQTLERLLMESPFEETSAAAAQRHQRHNSDLHRPGSPRHFLERLMYEGLKTNLERRISSREKEKDQQGKDASGNPSFAKRITDDIEGQRNEEICDIESIAQRIIDERAAMVPVFQRLLTEMLPSGSVGLAGTMKTTESFDFIFSSPSTSDQAHDGLRCSSTSPAVGNAANGTTMGSFGSSDGSGPRDDDDLDPLSEGVTAGDPSLMGSGEGDEISGGESRDAGKKIKEFLGSIFGGGHRGGEDSGAGSGRKGWREEDSSRTKSDPAGMRPKTPVAILDPPGREPPKRPPKDDQDSRWDRDDDDAENRNAVNYGDDIPEGDLSVFRRLGSDAVIHVAAQKVEYGQKYVLLVGESAPFEDPKMGPGLQVYVVKQWVRYEEAVDFLKKGDSGVMSPVRERSRSVVDSVVGNRGTDGDDDDDTSSPFYGGQVTMM